jgi:hypothetical protein
MWIFLKQQMQRNIKLTILLILGLAVIGPLTLLWIVLIFYPSLQEMQLRYRIYIPDESQYVYEAEGAYSGGSRKVSLYYWIADNLNNTRASLEYVYPAFQTGNAAEQWWITAVQVSGGSGNALTQNSVVGAGIGHESLCDYRYPYTCFSLVLVDLREEDIMSLPIRTPEQFAPQIESTLYKVLHELPSEGTLMIYTYFEKDY